MDKKRRDFFSRFGSNAAAVATGAAVPALIHLNSLSEELRALGRGLDDKLGAASTEMKAQVQSLHNRLDGAALTMSYQQMQLCFIFLLLVLSFAIDAGATAIWVLS
jgi:hypothetical protein